MYAGLRVYRIADGSEETALYEPSESWEDRETMHEDGTPFAYSYWLCCFQAHSMLYK